MALVKPTSRVYSGANPLSAWYKGTRKVWEPPAAGGAVRFTGTSGQSLKCSALGLTLATTSITWCAWVKLMGDMDFYSWVMCSDDASANYVQFGTTANGTQLYLSSNSGGGGSAFNFTIGTWTFIAAAMDKSGTAPWLYHCEAPGTSLGGGAADYIYTLPAGFLDTNTYYIGNGGFNNPINASIAAVKVWNAALSQAELEAELLKYSPVRTANLWSSYTFRNGPQTNDESGNGRTLTMTGTPVLDTAGPPCT
jgi:hypothetical protein